MFDITDPRGMTDTPLVPTLLERGVQRWPDDIVVDLGGGRTWKWTEALGRALAAARVLEDIGVRKGSCVGVFIRNSCEFLLAWWGAAILGAVIVPVNVAFKGQQPANTLTAADVGTVVADSDLSARLAASTGGMAEFLVNQPESPDDRSHRLRYLVCRPIPAGPDAFIRPFGLPGILSGCGSTEQGCSVSNPPSAELRVGSCGDVRPGYQVRLVDEHDIEVRAGQVGEAIVRADMSWMLFHGYAGDTIATLQSMRNGWFHTGDLMCQDADGYLFIHDRENDAIRHRGKNVSCRVHLRWPAAISQQPVSVLHGSALLRADRRHAPNTTKPDREVPLARGWQQRGHVGLPAVRLPHHAPCAADRPAAGI